jgi:energy-coupling factor transporter ATP-binding protein EcfA2
VCSAGLELLHQNVAAGAFHDAAERVDPPKCHPQTRLAILAEIQNWVRDPEIRKKLIIWLYGPAGSGKSAIAQTIAEIFAQEGLLVASFFFSRTGIWRNDTSRFIASISYQLSISIPELRTHIAIAVEQDPLVFSRTLLSQMQALVIKPLNDVASEITQTAAVQPRLVIIDGLDEARGETTQKELLQALSTSIQQLHIPLMFLVASRPEHIIRQTFNMEPLQSLMQGLPLDKHYKPDDDIRVFLSAKFSEVRTQHSSGNALPVLWPSQEDIDYLVRKASGQFIYASTVMKYIASSRRNPTKQLKIIRGLADPGKDTPFAQLDSLYDLILSSVDDITRVLEILALVFMQTGYDKFLSVDFIETLLGYEPGDVAAALIDMHALIQVPTSDSGDKNNNLRLYHASLHDFLMDKSRTQRFFLDARLRHTDLALRLFRYITTASKKEYERRRDLLRFSSLLEGFLNHYLEVAHMEDLVTDLKNFSLTSFLTNISVELFYIIKWDAFFNHLQTKV